MNKFYILTLVAAVSFSASAQKQLALHEATLSKTKVESPAVKKIAVSKDGLTRNDALRVAAKAATDVAGEYEITLGDYYFEDSVGEVTTDCSVSRNGNKLVFDSDYFAFSIEATYDEASATITFENSKLGLCNLGNAQYYIEFLPFLYDWTLNQGNGQVVELDKLEAKFDAQAAAITVPADHGFGWRAYTDAAYNSLAGWVDIFDLVGLEKVVEPENPNEGWTSLGKATLMDGWLCPAFGIDQTLEDNWYKVELQQNDDNKNLYRLVDPYHGDSPVAFYNQTSKSGYIQFDVTDPDHVVFTPVTAGFACAELEISKFYCINTLTSFTEYLGASVEETLATLAGAGANIPFTTYKDGVVTLESTLSEGKWMNDACFGIQQDPAAGYGWQDSEGTTVNMASKIFFPGVTEAGIGNVDAEADNSPARYFNLQGVEIAKPAPGSVVIRVQGGKANKFLSK